MLSGAFLSARGPGSVLTVEACRNQQAGAEGILNTLADLEWDADFLAGVGAVLGRGCYPSWRKNISVIRVPCLVAC